MDQSINYNLAVASSNTSLGNQVQTARKQEYKRCKDCNQRGKYFIPIYDFNGFIPGYICHSCDAEYKLCKECNKKSKSFYDFNEIHQICCSCDAKYKVCIDCNQKGKFFIPIYDFKRSKFNHICGSCNAKYKVCKECNQQSKYFSEIHQICHSCDAEYKKCKECNQRSKYFNKIYQICHSCECKICDECNQESKWVDWMDGNHQICNLCYKAKKIFIPSGNKVIDDFIRYTLINSDEIAGKMEFVPYDRFENVEFIAEGGFSKVYKATWIDGPWRYEKYTRHGEMTVALKELNNSKFINSRELNEPKIFYNCSLSWYENLKNSGNIGNINKCYGITQHPITQNFMIITSYYEKGDLIHYITNNFFDISWENKLKILKGITLGLDNIHRKDIIHKDYHGGNIFIGRGELEAITGDLGISKSSLNNDEDNEIYGVIPYVAPEIFQGQKYTKASDIYSFGMIMWELLTGRRSFWDKSHDIDLMIEICDGLRPPINGTSVPEGYIELMQQCWHPDPNKRPTATNLYYKFWNINDNGNSIKIVKSPDIGPIKNNPNAIYKSRPLSAMIKSAEFIRNLKSQSIILRSSTLNYDHNPSNDKRKFDNNLVEDNDSGKTKKIKLHENKNEDYLTKELGFDID